MKYRGAVFFDYDGTLTDDKTGIVHPTERTRQAVAALRKNGYLALLATGRAVCYADDTGIDWDGMVTSNGTYAVVGGETIYDHPVDDEALARLTARMNEMGIYYGIDNPEKCYARDLYEATFSDWLTTFNIRREIFRPIVPGEKPRGYKFSVLFHTRDQVETLRREFDGVFTFDCMRAYKCADVAMCGMNKATGVRAVVEHFELPLESTYAFGDGANDYSMLACVGHGVAMGDHAPELEKCADFVTKRVCEEGIEFGLRHYGLI